MKKALLPILALAALVACQPSGKSKADSRIHYQLAREYLSAGSADKAMAEVDVALKADGGNFDAAFLKADVLASTGRHEEALKVIETASEKIEPRDVYKKDHWLGVVYYQKGEMDKALERFNRSVAANPKFPQNYPMLAQTLAKMGKYQEAVTAYEKWTAVEPESELPWTQLGIAHLGTHNLDKAREALDKALAINPKSGLAYNYLGALAEERRQPKEAEAFFIKSIEFNPRNPFAHLNLAQLLIMQGRHKEALAPLNKTLEIQPDNQFAIFYLGRYYQMEKDFSKAADFYEKAVVKDPKLWVGRTGVAEVALAAGGMYDRAEKALNEGIAKDPLNQKGYYFHLARIGFAKGDFAAALRHIDKAAALLDPDDSLTRADCHLLRGRIYGAMKKNAEAEKEYQAAAQLAPGTAIEKDARKRLAH